MSKSPDTISPDDIVTKETQLLKGSSMRIRSDIWEDLRSGHDVQFEGAILIPVKGKLEPGDTYIAERNAGPKLLTVEKVVDDGGYVVPVEAAYPYDTWECIKVKIAE